MKWSILLNITVASLTFNYNVIKIIYLTLNTQNIIIQHLLHKKLVFSKKMTSFLMKIDVFEVIHQKERVFLGIKFYSQ